MTLIVPKNLLLFSKLCNLKLRIFLSAILKLELQGIQGPIKFSAKEILKSSIEDISLKELEKTKEIKVMLCGVIDPPDLVCCKQVYDTITKQNKVPIALKPVSGTQKFRIQFKNNGSKEVEADFSFVKIGENKEGEFSMNT